MQKKWWEIVRGLVRILVVTVAIFVVTIPSSEYTSGEKLLQTNSGSIRKRINSNENDARKKRDAERELVDYIPDDHDLKYFLYYEHKSDSSMPPTTYTPIHKPTPAPAQYYYYPTYKPTQHAPTQYYPPPTPTPVVHVLYPEVEEEQYYYEAEYNDHNDNRHDDFFWNDDGRMIDNGRSSTNVEVVHVSPSIDNTSNGGGEEASCSTIAEIICQTEGFNLFCEALTMIEFIDLFSGSSQQQQQQQYRMFTVFAPTDEAFIHLSEQYASTGKLNPTSMSDLLSFHIVATENFFNSKANTAAIQFQDLVCNEWLLMMNGQSTLTHCRGFDKYQVGRGNGVTNKEEKDVDTLSISVTDSPLIVRENIMACNGIIHSVAKVMLPESW